MDGKDAVAVHLITPATTPGSTIDEERYLTLPVTKAEQVSLKNNWNVPLWNLVPYFMASISIVQILIFALADENTSKLLRFEPQVHYQAWRFTSYMLLHWGLTHLILNVVIQCLLAIVLEVEQDGARTVVVYLGGGFYGALGASIFQPQPMVGASAGVYALLISHLAHLYLNLNIIKYRKFRVFSVCVLAISDIVFYAIHSKTAGHPQISLGAHASGGLAGALLGLVIYKGSEKSHGMYQVYVKWSSFIALCVLTVLSIVALSVLPTEFFVR